MKVASVRKALVLVSAAAAALGCGGEGPSSEESATGGMDAPGGVGSGGRTDSGGLGGSSTGGVGPVVGAGGFGDPSGGVGTGGASGGTGGTLPPGGGTDPAGAALNGGGDAGGRVPSGGTGGGSSTGGSHLAGGNGGIGELGGATASGGGGSGGGVGSGGDGGVTSGGSNTGGTGGGPTEDRIVTFHNGVFWKDTDGNRIEAHGGGFLKEGDTWYWIGEDKAANSGNFRAVNCYASTDLVNWEFRNAIITRDTAPELNTADRIIERPKVIYNDSTHKYVMWVHWEGQSYAEAKAGVFQSDTIDGDYVYVRSFRPNNNMSRDDTLFQDDDPVQTAYFISAANENRDLMVYRLTPDYLDIQEQTLMLWQGQSREAPAMFKHEGRYFLLTSQCTGWDPNQGSYSSSVAIDGSWGSLTKFGDGITYDTQPTYVIPVVGTRATTYIYAGDRWQDPDLASSKYIWLPLRVNGATLSLDYYDTWQLDLTTGEWVVQDEFIPQTGWTLLHADSEETEGEDGEATNAFDDSASTYWHTAWDGPGHPHEIQIDLGAVYDIEGMRHLPRQDVDDHGMVADYEFFVSQDPNAWGSPVATGTFGTGRSETRVPFAVTSGRYIRFVALNDINGDVWTSIAELDLIAAD
ncbi:MAG: discoidin domain-containing protein [Polyangiaceae bacterium]|nr:discoidin domain-containing protein [Polyangiaceae bacterium]